MTGHWYRAIPVEIQLSIVKNHWDANMAKRLELNEPKSQDDIDFFLTRLSMFPGKETAQLRENILTDFYFNSPHRGGAF